jgi:hypothetical protein
VVVGFGHQVKSAGLFYTEMIGTKGGFITAGAAQRPEEIVHDPGLKT